MGQEALAVVEEMETERFCSDEDHARLKTSEEVFRRGTIVLGVQRLSDEAPLLMGNCPACLSTLGYTLDGESK